MAINEQVLSDLKSYLKSEEIEPYLSQFYTDETYSGLVKSSANRFLVNLYESQGSNKIANKWANKKTILNNSIFQPEKKINLDYESNDSIIQKTTMNQFLNLRNKRDIECLKLKEASNLIKYLNKQLPYGHWNERLLAEKVLLESGVAADILKNKIREEYNCIKIKDIQIGKISISNLKFHLNQQSHTKSNKTDFYILLLSSENDVVTSKIQRASNGDVEFNETFIFPINRNFQIKLQLYSILMKEPSKIYAIASCLPGATTLKRHNCLKLQYKNLNTCDFEETKVLKTSFKLCAETEIIPENLHNKAWKLKLARSSILNEFVTILTKIEDFKIEFQKFGFMTFGRLFQDRIVWNRRWCLLDGSNLKMYYSPTNNNFTPPELVLDLLKSSSSVIEEAPRMICNRRRSLMIPFKEENYFFMADNYNDLKSWLKDLNVILDLLKFKENYKL